MTESRTQISVPGKTILMGEHAAVYGRPALVAEIDRRLRVGITPRAGSMAYLSLPDLGIRREVSWEEILTYTRATRDRWSDYRARPGAGAFQQMRGEDPAHVVMVALGEAAEHLGETDEPGLRLELRSEIPIGAGFGSSAAAAVAVIYAYLAWRGAPPAPDVLHRLSLDVERRQHGTPSGVDNATVAHGGLVWAKREDSGFVTEPLAADSPLLEDLQLFHTGSPREATGAVVAAVRQRLDAEPQRIGEALDAMEEATWGLRREISARRADGARVVRLLRRFEACLEVLGVVPEPVRQRIREIEAQGGAAKISGAGALTGEGAGSLLVYHPEPESVAAWSDLFTEWTPLTVRLGAPGLRREPEAGGEAAAGLLPQGLS